MASGNIRGITIEIGGDTKNLEQALSSVSQESKKLQAELKTVERGLKFDPGNVELVRQRQELLTQSIGETSQRLEILRNAQAQVQRQYDAGEIPIDQYRSFQRELQFTESQLGRLQGSLNAIDSEQERLGQTTRSLATFFQATNTTVEDFASTLGSRLTQSIRDGSASADQIERALRLMGQQALGAGADINELRTALRQIDDGGSIQDVRRDLGRIEEEANGAGDAIDGFGKKLGALGAGLAATGGLAALVSNALDVSTLDTKIDITLALPEESKAAVRESIRLLESFEIEGEEALEGVRRQFALNRDATDEANAATVRYAGSIAAAYSDIDFKELIQESNEIASSFKINNDEALGLVNSLLRIGFPPDQLDIISEYGSQLIRAGFSAEQVQATFAAGVDTGSYNIDILLDGLQEGRLRLTEFGNGVDENTQKILQGTGISAQALQEYGAAVARGGVEGQQAYIDVANAVAGIDDALLRNTVGVALFGTLYEQNGDLVTQTLVESENQVVSLEENQRILNETVNGLEDSPAVRLRDAFNSLQEALQPVYEFIANVIVGLTDLIEVAFNFISTTQEAIGGLDSLGSKFSEIFQTIQDIALSIFGPVVDFLKEKYDEIVQFFQEDGDEILSAIETTFNAIQAIIDFIMPAILFVIEYVWEAIQNVITGALDVILGVVKAFSSVLDGDFRGLWEGITQIFSGAINLIIGLMSLSFVGGIRKLVTDLFKNLTNVVKTQWTSISNTFKSFASSIPRTVGELSSKVVTTFSNLRTTVTSLVKTLATNIVSAIQAVPGQFLSIGKNITQGLINGIKSLDVVTFIKGFIGNIVDVAKAILGIKSPSRAFMEIGDFVGQGLAIGINGTKGLNERAITELNGVIIKSATDNAKEVTAIAQKAEKERTDIQKKYADQRAKAQVKSSKETQKTARDRAAKLTKINADEAAALKKINDKAFADITKKQQEVNKLNLEAIQKFIKDKKDLNQLSLSDEAEYRRVAYNLARSGTAERATLEKEYQETVRTINDQITSTNESFLSRAQKINDDLIKSEEDLNKKYQDTLNSRYQTLVNAYGLFDEVASEDLADPQVLVDNLNAQVNALQRFQNSIQTFRNKGISGALLEDLQDLGPKANAQLEALNRLTDAELLQYQQTYEERSRIARETAVRELEPLAKDTETQIQNLRNVANKQLTDLNTEWQAQIKKVVNGTDTQLKTLNQVGKNAGQSLLDGLTSVQSSLLSKAQEIATGISRTINESLGLGSYSSVSLPSSSANLSSAVTNARASLNSSAVQSTNNQAASVAAAQSNNIDMASLVKAVSDLASRPIQTAVNVNGQTIANSVSGYQYSNANIAALQKGVTL